MQNDPAINFTIEDFTEFLLEKEINLKCLMCSSTHFEVYPHLHKGQYAACPVRDESAHITDHHIPSIYCMCQNCGYQITFSPMFISEWKAEKNAT